MTARKRRRARLAGALVLLVTGPAASAQEAISARSEPGTASPPVRFGTVQLSTGVRLHFAERGMPSREPLIMLHGLSDSWFSFSRIMPLMSTRYQVYALDQRGHGRSEQPTGGYAMSELAADVLAFMDAKGINRATIVGHSMGSFVAQQVALAAPDRVRALVLVGSGTSVRHLIDFDKVFAELRDPVSMDFIREFQLSTIGQPVPEAFLEEVIRESQRLSAHVWRAAWRGLVSAPAPNGLGALEVPTLLIHGEKDTAFPLSELRALNALVPRASLITYPEIGHAVHWETPGRFVRDLEAFIARRGGARGG